MSKINKPSSSDISDEQLSAFLDAELSEAEMEKIRQALAEDEALASRISELSMADELIAGHYAKIDDIPLSPELKKMLDELPDDPVEEQSSKVIKLSLWQKWKRSANQQLATAASVALVAGFGLAQLANLNQSPSSGDFAMQDWNRISQLLNAEPSNKVIDLDGNQLQAKLSFTDKQGQFCRQFEIVSQAHVQNSIACKSAANWHLAASFYHAKLPQGDYQTASSGGALRQTIDLMAQGPLLNPPAEIDAINNNWQPVDVKTNELNE